MNLNEEEKDGRGWINIASLSAQSIFIPSSHHRHHHGTVLILSTLESSTPPPNVPDPHSSEIVKPQKG